MSDLEAREWVKVMREMYKKANIKGSMQYGGQFYSICEAFGLDPEETKKEIENE